MLDGDASVDLVVLRFESLLQVGLAGGVQHLRDDEGALAEVDGLRGRAAGSAGRWRCRLSWAGLLDLADELGRRAAATAGQEDAALEGQLHRASVGLGCYIVEAGFGIREPGVGA